MPSVLNISYSVEKSPSPVYGARLELVYALIAHRGFESLLLRQRKLTVSADDAVSFLILFKKYKTVLLKGACHAYRDPTAFPSGNG